MKRMKKSSLVEGKREKKEPGNETRIQGIRKVSPKEWNHFTSGLFERNGNGTSS